MAFLSLRALRPLLAALLAGATLFAAEPRPAQPELQVKAAFLLNFAAFVDWPEKAFASSTSPIVVGVVGRDPFGPALDEIFSGETMRGRSFQLKRIPSGGNPAGCHIVFVADSERRDFAALLKRLRGQAVLTVGNAPGFLQAGGMVEFFTDRGRIRFRINHRTAQDAGLVMSSKLLRLAQGNPP